MGQCFNKDLCTSSFENNIFPKLLHVCKAENNHNKFPRIMHMHDDMAEIVFIREGSGIHIIGNTKYETKKGDILIYNKGILHDERSSLESYTTTYCCGISNLYIKGLKKNYLISDDVTPVINSGEYFKRIESIFEILHLESLSNMKGSEETCNYLLLSLITIVLRSIDLFGDKMQKEAYELGETIKKYIDENFLNDISLLSMSQALGISQYYLAHRFKERTGYSPIQYIINRRIGEAQSLLINTNNSVIQIASMIGYDNPHYFNMLFTKTVGMSPGKYRKTMNF